MNSPGLEIEWRHPDQIRPYGRNVKHHTPRAIQDMKLAIEEFGWVQPIVVDVEDVIVIGTKRWLAGKSLGQPVPVHVARELSPEKIRALRILDNRLSQQSPWEKENLLSELRALQEVQQLGEKALMTGFDDDTIAKMLGAKKEETAEVKITAKLNEKYDYVVVLVENATDWAWLSTLCGLKPERSYKNSRVGTGHVLTLARLQQAIDDRVALLGGKGPSE